MAEFIDLRSDTVTKPTPAMRRAMAEAEVGDDVFGEDPTVNALQERVAALLGKEKALFVPSGTMANQLAIKAHTQPGDEVILEASAHPYNFEGGASAGFVRRSILLPPGRPGDLGSLPGRGGHPPPGSPLRRCRGWSAWRTPITGAAGASIR